MNKGRPVSALARFAAWQIRSRIKDEVLVDWIGGAKLAVKRGMTGATGNIYCGLHEFVDMRFVLDTLGPDDVFVDVGANVGSYTILASKVCGARVFAIEPDPVAIMALRRNIEINGVADRVTVVEAAVGEEDGTAQLTIGRDTVNRVVDVSAEDTREVRMMTLDDILAGSVPNVMKLDVEGYEASVLAGAKATLRQPALRAIISETIDQRVLDIVGEAGFSRSFYDPDSRRIARSPSYTSGNSLLLRRQPESEP